MFVAKQGNTWVYSSEQINQTEIIIPRFYSFVFILCGLSVISALSIWFFTSLKREHSAVIKGADSYVKPCWLRHFQPRVMRLLAVK